MDERVVQFRVGVMVLATIIIAGILVLLFGNVPTLMRGSYAVKIHFAEAPGVAQDTPIRKSGILIGRVSKVEFDPKGGVIVTAQINSDVQLRKTEVPRLSNSLLGDAELQFVQGPNKPAPTPTTIPVINEKGEKGAIVGDQSIYIQPNEQIQGAVVGNPLQIFSNMEGDLNHAVKSLSNAGDEVAKLATTMNKALAGTNEEQVQRIMKKTESALDGVSQFSATMNDLFGDPTVRANLKQSIADLPNVMRDTHATIKTMGDAMTLVETNLKNLEGFTKPLGERGAAMVDNIDQSVARLDELLAQMVQFSKTLNNGQGSLQKFLNDPELYQRLNLAALNIEQATCQLQPIMDDARIFTDKLARHPEVLTRGIIRPSSGIK